ncbi:MAG TPA: TonB-dependent receptor [Steroidobacteraceae bacterium]|nr:TonB-dependent receptor [Steroidobacteraceae bacterium]
MSNRTKRAQRAALMTAFALDILCAAVPSKADQAADAAKGSDTIEEVVVTGYRASLESAIARKRASNQPIESIVAEDIGKMPDQNVAESLQRLPGVQINRSGGKGTQVLIDGLQNNLITLNGEVFLTGREMYVSGEASGGGNGGNVQYASLEGIPSEQIGGIDVIKNPNASNREGGLGGTINLITRSALAQKDGFSLAANIRGTQADDAEGSVTPNATLVGGFKFSDNFGVTVGLSYDDEKTRDKQFQDQNRSEWRVTDAAQIGSYAGSPSTATLSTMPGGQLYIIPQLAYLSDVNQQVKNKGATLGVDFKWSDSIKSSFNYFYVNETDESFTYSNKVWFNGQGSPVGSLHPGIDPSQPYSIDANGVVESATFMANGAETATLYQNLDAKSNTFQFSTAFESGGPLSGDFALAYAKASGDFAAAQADVEHGLYNYRTAAGTGSPTSPAAPGCDNGGAACDTGNHGYAFNWTNGGTSGLPTVSYPDAFGYTDLLSNPAYTTFKSNWAWANQTDEKNTAIKGNLHFDTGKGLTISGGLRFAKRDVDQIFGRFLIDAATLGTGGAPAGTSAGNCCISDIPGQSGTNIYYSDPGYATIPFSIAGTLPPGSAGASNPDLVKLYSSFASGTIAVKDPHVGGMTNPSTYLSTLWGAGGVANPNEAFFEDTISSFGITEKTTSFYLMGDTGSSDSSYHADFGVRVVKTQLDIDSAQPAPLSNWYGTASWNGLNSNNVAIKHGRSYTDVLPSFNFVFDLSDDQKIRTGAARVVAPQNLMDLGRGNSYNFTRGPNDPQGNAQFQFANGNAGNPNLDPFRATQYSLSWEDYFSPSGLVSAGFFYKQVDNFVTTANIPTLVDDDFGGTVGNVATPVNGGKGKIYGFELSGQYAWENGFGLAANYTYSDSKSDQDTAFATDLPIPGVSKNSANFIAFYEHFGFSARAAYAWRSKSVNSSLVGSTFSFPDQNGVQQVYGVYADSYGQLDAQIGYDFSSHFGLTLSGVNLTNEKQHTYLQYPNLPFTYDDTGKRIFFGFKAKM